LPPKLYEMVKLSDDIYKQIMWDYDIPKEDVEKLLSGEAERAGHYDREEIFLKMLQSLSWFALIRTLGIEFVSKNLSDKIIKRIWIKSIREKYSYVKTRLHEIIPSAG